MLTDVLIFAFWLVGLLLLLALWPTGRVLFLESFAHPRQTLTIIAADGSVTVERSERKR
jgi:hypothetical protein